MGRMGKIEVGVSGLGVELEFSIRRLGGGRVSTPTQPTLPGGGAKTFFPPSREGLGEGKTLANQQGDLVKAIFTKNSTKTILFDL